MSDANRLVAKNAMANLARGGAAGVVALVLPAVLVRHLTQIDYTVWVLVLQLTAYSAYLDFGLQTAIGRYVAFANQKRNSDLRDGIFSTAFIGLSLACLICLILLFAVAASARWIFPQIPTELLPPLRWALLILGCSVALGLPSSAWSGVFTGLQKNEIPAVVIGGTKVISALVVVAVALRWHSIILMSSVLAAFNLLSYGILFAVAKKVAPEVRFQRALVRWSSAKELGSYCYSLTIWSLAMLLVTGLDLLLVGRFQVAALAPYAIAASLVTLVAGGQSAIFSALMPRAAVVHAQENPVALGEMALRSTRYGVLLLIFTGMPILLFANPILCAWVGPHYAIAAHSLLVILVVANMIRLTGIPYSVVLIGTGQQKIITISPLVEGITNLIASVALGLKFGALGVAWGTLIGAVVGVSGNLLYNIPHTSKVIRLRASKYLLGGIVLPGLAAIPFLAIIQWPTLMRYSRMLFFAVFLSVVSIIVALYKARAIRPKMMEEFDGRWESMHAKTEHP